ncbi:DNA-3-methyladenine glycosylase I [Aeromonas caviae]
MSVAPVPYTAHHSAIRTGYACMQAVGMVNDHLVTCPCHAGCQQAAAT